MFPLLAVLSTLQLISVVLVLVLLFLGFKLFETTWSYRISKPHAWEEAVAAGTISKELKRMERFYRDKVRFYNLWLQVERLKLTQVAGTFAEVGVYKGETARMIHAMDPSRQLFLFDTFSGFTEGDLALERSDNLKRVDFRDTSVEEVSRHFQSKNIRFIQGTFPETTAGLSEQAYALVHLDADLYRPTLEGLKYFYPRLSKGGVIIMHDYNHDWEGVRKAVDEFMATIPERLIAVPDWQGSVMIIRNA